MSEETKETKTRTSITITPSLYDAAKACAKVENFSFSSFVEHCISKYLASATPATAPVAAEPEAAPATEA